ncbi:hypothetical protein VTJ49DRAFT_1817 [Mycothermus thermophilus]|uniref:Extracellular serine-rich protein n=1 Tax=Humicola insolens TaxID=85995 RepID=A0ABR3VDF3_HUMIN
MLTTHILGLLAVLAGPATAQTDIHTSSTADSDSSSSSATATSSSSKGPATVTIAVGARGHIFTPSEAKANVGDIIKFNFYPGGHRVARAEFGWPCIPYEYANIGKQGFYTGAFYPQVVSNDPPSYSVRVNDTEPIFFYCAAPGSCVDYQMIGVINPNSTHTLAKQLEYGRDTTYQLEPGEPFPSETAHVRPSSTAGPAPSETNSSGSGSGSDQGSNSGGSGLSAGAIAGIAIGGAAVLILVGVLLYLCGRRGGFERAYRKSMTFAGGGGGGGGAAAGVLASPTMVEARYANANTAAGSPGVGLGFGQSPKDFPAGSISPTTAGFYGPTSPHSPSLSLPPGAAAPAYYSQAGAETSFTSPQASPRTDQYTATPAPVELPTQPPAHAPPKYYSVKDARRDDMESPWGEA